MRVERVFRHSLFVVGLLLLAACDNATPADNLASAEGAYAQREYRTAVLHLKNALQQQPDLADARLLLGRSYLQLGDYPSALKELERALDLGESGDDLTLGLLTAKNNLGRHAEVIGELEGVSSLAPEFAAVLADAYLAGGDSTRAEALYRQAEELASGNIGLGILAWMRGDVAQARRYLTRATTLDSFNARAWLRLAELELASSASEAAKNAFEQARGLPTGRLAGEIGLARTSLVEGNLALASEHVSEALRLAPELSVGHYIEGLIRFQQQDFDGAEASIRAVQRDVPNHAPSLYLMGVIKFRQGQYRQARDNLERFLAVSPDNESAAKVLASVYLQQQDLDAVEETLEAFAESSNDPQLLAMLGTTKLRLGQAAAATGLLEKAVELAPDAANFKNQLALSLVSAGDRASAQNTLRSAIEVDGSQYQSDYLLAMLELQQGDFEAAGKTIDATIERNPDSPLAFNLRGIALLGLGDETGARAAFARALEIDVGYVPAAGNLARMDLSDGNVSAASVHFENVLTADPANEAAKLALAELALKRGEQDAAARYLTEIVDANSRSLRARSALGRLLLAENQPALALEQLDAALLLAPESPSLLLSAAEADLRLGNVARARERTDRLQSLLSSGVVNAQRRGLGLLQSRLGQLTLARENLEYALSQAPDNPASLRELARIDLREGALADARLRLERLRLLAPEEPETRLLEGDLLRVEGDPGGAKALYRSLAEEGFRDGAIRLTQLLLSQGDTGAASEILDSWLRTNPEDLGVRLLRADVLLRTADIADAIAEYEQLLDTRNPVVLNNLAWLYMERGDERALEVAQQAYDLLPGNADIADTLGWVLYKRGRATEALKFLRESVRQDPRNASVHFHLGLAEREAGDRAAAISALEKALTLGEFPERKSTEDVLGELRGLES